jgi:hypothetical protein
MSKISCAKSLAATSAPIPAPNRTGPSCAVQIPPPYHLGALRLLHFAAAPWRGYGLLRSVWSSLTLASAPFPDCAR